MHRPSSAIQFTDKNDFRTNKTLTSIALTKGVALRNHFLSDLNHELPNTIMTTGYTAVLYATKNIKNIAYHAFFYEFFAQLVNKIPRHSVSLPTDLFNLPSLISVKNWPSLPAVMNQNSLLSDPITTIDPPFMRVCVIGFHPM